MIGAALRLETPEGIDLEIDPAGPVARGLALSIDLLITQTATGIAGIGLLMAGSAGFGLYLILMFLVEWFYPVLFEVLRRGQTPGKRMLGLRVVNADATPVGWSASIVRNLLRTADLFPFFYLAGLTTMCMTARFQRLGDLAAETLVIHAREIRVEEESLDPTEDLGLGARTSPIPLSASEQRALIDFAERRREFSTERAIEIADRLEPLTGKTGEEGVVEVLRIANGIAGRA